MRGGRAVSFCSTHRRHYRSSIGCAACAEDARHEYEATLPALAVAARNAPLATLSQEERLREAGAVLLTLLDEIDEYQRHPDRGDPDAECRCCRGEILDRGDLAKIADARRVLTAEKPL